MENTSDIPDGSIGDKVSMEDLKTVLGNSNNDPVPDSLSRINKILIQEQKNIQKIRENSNQNLNVTENNTLKASQSMSQPPITDPSQTCKSDLGTEFLAHQQSLLKKQMATAKFMQQQQQLLQQQQDVLRQQQYQQHQYLHPATRPFPMPPGLNPYSTSPLWQQQPQVPIWNINNSRNISSATSPPALSPIGSFPSDEIALLEARLAAAKRRKIEGPSYQFDPSSASSRSLPDVSGPLGMIQMPPFNPSQDMDASDQVKYVDAKKTMIPGNWPVHFQARPGHTLAQILTLFNKYGRLVPTGQMVTCLPSSGSKIGDGLSVPARLEAMSDMEYELLVRTSTAVLWSNILLNAQLEASLHLKIPKSIDAALSQIGEFTTKMSHVFKPGHIQDLFQQLANANTVKLQIMQSLRFALPADKRKVVDGAYVILVAKATGHAAHRDWPDNMPFLESMMLGEEAFRYADIAASNFKDSSDEPITNANSASAVTPVLASTQTPVANNVATQPTAAVSMVDTQAALLAAFTALSNGGNPFPLLNNNTNNNGRGKKKWFKRNKNNQNNQTNNNGNNNNRGNRENDNNRGNNRTDNNVGGNASTTATRSESTNRGRP